MEHHNRDKYERSHMGEDLYHRSSRYASGSPKRKDFVVSFIASAIVGSALGLYYKNKVYKKTDELKEKEIRNKVLDYKHQAENTVHTVKDIVENLKSRSNNGLTAEELQAQKVAIQREVSNNNLADESPEAQEIQAAKAEAQSSKHSQETSYISKDKQPTAISKDKQPTAKEVAIAQTAIKKESSDNNLASPTVTEGQNEDKVSHSQAENVASAAQTKKDKINNDSQVAKNTKDLMQEESIAQASNKTVPNLVTNNEKDAQSSNEDSFAMRLALAAKTKKSKLTKGSKESQLTESLLKEPAIARNSIKTVPTLITESKTKKSKITQQQNSTKDKNKTVTSTQDVATFDNGVITHEKTTKVQKKSTKSTTKVNNSAKKQTNTPKQNNRNQKHKVEKTDSKIEKRTFND